jgi:hypothetical protein
MGNITEFQAAQPLAEQKARELAYLQCMAQGAAYVLYTPGAIKKAGQRHATHNFVDAIHSLKYHALAWAKQE